MGIWNLLKRLLDGELPLGRELPAAVAKRQADAAPEKYDLADLARRLEVPVEHLRAIEPAYHEYHIPKRSGGTRRIAASVPELKALQRRILRRLLGRLRAHPCATGFERGQSIVTNAAPHTGKAVVVRMDVRDFFGSTTAERVRQYFRRIGWSNEAADVLVKLCTWQGALPQGAPTSPRLSNLVNYQLDARLAGLRGVTYTRYADDLTFSFPHDDHGAVKSAISFARVVVGEYGYRLHGRKKLRVRRRHQSQRVTGLVVNDRVALPRSVRRWLRAVEHRIQTGGEASLSADQLAGWYALAHMVETQAPRG